MAYHLLLVSIIVAAIVSFTTGEIDIFQPIVKISPAKNAGYLDDYFGYSVTAHQLFTNSSGLSLGDVLDQTLIISGAPRGRYPGGLPLPLDWRVCQEYQSSNCASHQALLMNYTQEQILSCYNNIITGLVYKCPLGPGSCNELSGNGNALSSDGKLFDSIGDYATNCQQSHTKHNQLMGSLVYSTGDYFMACAPLYTYVSRFVSDVDVRTPIGMCLLSNRDLTDFSSITPCPGGPTIETTQIGNVQFCSSGISGTIFGPQLVIGAPTYSGFGAIFDYSNINMLQISQRTSPESNTDQYYGFNMASGYITNQVTKDVIVSAPNYRANGSIGRVYIYENVSSQTDIISLYGQQSGEHFGYSLAVMDLNNDGWDDVLVGAPFYSDLATANIKNNLGRVFVYRNTKGNLTLSSIIVGQAVNGQFGLSITSLGDINNDGYDDVAISAPFEGSGIVYIYHGQSMDNEGSIINTTAQQRIDGADVARQVTNLTSVSTFGYSISGTVDVDQNQYRDLVIGAYESQSVFVFRSRAVAIAQISISTTLNEVRLDSYQCTYNNLPIDCFSVKVCTQYYGKGLESGFNTTYRLSEVIQNNQAPRLFFTNPSENFVIRDISYVGVNMSYCDNVTIYIKNGTSSSDISDFNLMAELLQLNQSTSPVNTNSVPIDISQLPTIQATPTMTTLRIATPCGDDDICDSDLMVTVNNLVFKNDNSEVSTYQNQFVIGDSSHVDFDVVITNNQENAFNSFLNFTVQRNTFIQVQLLNTSLGIRCVSSQNETVMEVNCRELQSPLARNEILRLRFRLTADPSVQGNEGNVIIPVVVGIPEQSRNRENASYLANNIAFVSIQFSAITSYDVDVFYTPNDQVLYYFANGSATVTNNDSSSLGERLTIQMSLSNRGPSPFRGNVTLYIPAQYTPDTGQFYYYYPANLANIVIGGRSNLFSCDTSQLNPDNYLISNVNKRRRKRNMNDKLLPLMSLSNHYIRKRQSSTQFNLDCQTTPNNCIKVNCIAVLYGRTSVSARVIGYIDERFFRGKTRDYSFRAFIRAVVTDGYTETNGSINQDNISVRLVKFLDIMDQDITLYIFIIVPAIIVAIIFIIVLAICLYCFGFFKKKRKQEDKTDAYEDTYTPVDPDAIPDDEIKDAKDFETAPQTTTL